MKNCLALFFAIIPVSLLAQQNAYVSLAGTKFLLYTPPGYETSTEPYPLLVSLHGKGEWGGDLTKLTSGNSTGMPSRLIRRRHSWDETDIVCVLCILNAIDQH